MSLAVFHKSWVFRHVAIWVLINFFFSCHVTPPITYAQSLAQLPQPGKMIQSSEAFAPLMIKGLRIHADQPLLFDFMIDTGKTGTKVDSSDFKNEADKLIKYFLTAMTIKEDDLWVNLSPYEKDRMIADDLGQTLLGQDMLAQDYVLKQLTASLIYPEKELGQAFWSKVYAQAKSQFGTTEVPVDTFNKVWIVADKARVLERDNTAYVVGAHLRVMLDADYKAQQAAVQVPSADGSHEIAKQVLREVVVPAIEREVNEGRHFTALRQMYYAMILASWYKRAIKSGLLNEVYSNQGKVGGVKSDDPSAKDKVYELYLEAYKRGVFNLIKEEPAGANGETIPRKYFSGGELFAPALKNLDMGVISSASSSEIANTIQGDLAMVSTALGQVKSADDFDAELYESQVGRFWEAMREKDLDEAGKLLLLMREKRIRVSYEAEQRFRLAQGHYVTMRMIEINERIFQRDKKAVDVMIQELDKAKLLVQLNTLGSLAAFQTRDLYERTFNGFQFGAKIYPFQQGLIELALDRAQTAANHRELQSLLAGAVDIADQIQMGPETKAALGSGWRPWGVSQLLYKVNEAVLMNILGKLGVDITMLERADIYMLTMAMLDSVVLFEENKSGAVEKALDTKKVYVQVNIDHILRAYPLIISQINSYAKDFIAESFTGKPAQQADELETLLNDPKALNARVSDWLEKNKTIKLDHSVVPAMKEQVANAVRRLYVSMNENGRKVIDYILTLRTLPEPKDFSKDVAMIASKGEPTDPEVMQRVLSLLSLLRSTSVDDLNNFLSETGKSLSTEERAEIEEAVRGLKQWSALQWEGYLKALETKGYSLEGLSLLADKMDGVMAQLSPAVSMTVTQESWRKLMLRDSIMLFMFSAVSLWQGQGTGWKGWLAASALTALATWKAVRYAQASSMVTWSQDRIRLEVGNFLSHPDGEWMKGMDWIEMSRLYLKEKGEDAILRKLVSWLNRNKNLDASSSYRMAREMLKVMRFAAAGGVEAEFVIGPAILKEGNETDEAMLASVDQIRPGGHGVVEDTAINRITDFPAGNHTISVKFGQSFEKDKAGKLNYLGYVAIVKVKTGTQASVYRGLLGRNITQSLVMEIRHELETALIGANINNKAVSLLPSTVKTIVAEKLIQVQQGVAKRPMIKDIILTITSSLSSDAEVANAIERYAGMTLLKVDQEERKAVLETVLLKEYFGRQAKGAAVQALSRNIKHVHRVDGTLWRIASVYIAKTDQTVYAGEIVHGGESPLKVFFFADTQKGDLTSGREARTSYEIMQMWQAAHTSDESVLPKGNEVYIPVSGGGVWRVQAFYDPKEKEMRYEAELMTVDKNLKYGESQELFAFVEPSDKDTSGHLTIAKARELYLKRSDAAQKVDMQPIREKFDLVGVIKYPQFAENSDERVAQAIKAWAEFENNPKDGYRLSAAEKLERTILFTHVLNDDAYGPLAKRAALESIKIDDMNILSAADGEALQLWDNLIEALSRMWLNPGSIEMAKLVERTAVRLQLQLRGVNTVSTHLNSLLNIMGQDSAMNASSDEIRRILAQGPGEERIEHTMYGRKRVIPVGSDHTLTISFDTFIDRNFGDGARSVVQLTNHSRILLTLPMEGDLTDRVAKSWEMVVGRIDANLNGHDAAMKAPGGIDLNAAKLNLDIENAGTIRVNFDPMMIEEFKQGNFSGVTANIIKITPIADLQSILMP